MHEVVLAMKRTETELHLQLASKSIRCSKPNSNGLGFQKLWRFSAILLFLFCSFARIPGFSVFLPGWNRGLSRSVKSYPKLLRYLEVSLARCITCRIDDCVSEKVVFFTASRELTILTVDMAKP